MAGANYWAAKIGRKVTRRRAIVAGGIGLGSALLVGCGGGNSASKSQSSETQGSALLTRATDSTKQARPGGTMKLSVSADPVNWDPHFTQAGWNIYGGLMFSRLTIIKPGILQTSEGEVIGDLAESFEYSPDRLSMTFKLRKNAAWHDVAPVNGRLMDADDVLFTWKRFVAVATNRSAYAHEVNPNSPIISIAAPDKNTITLKLAYPMATLAALLSVTPGGSFTVVPREAESKFDPKLKSIGTGPFFLSEQVPSSRFVVKKHPGYYDIKTGPHVDGAEYATIPEYATGLAQLRAGGLYTFGVRSDDILNTKGDVPDLSLYLGNPVTTGTNAFFGFRPTEKNVFRDERVRQAYSTALDRDLFIDVKLNVSKLVGQGIALRTFWNTAVGYDLFPGWWVDPKSKDFGPNAKYFQHDVAEAKKLLAAAGYPGGVDVTSTHISTADYGNDYPKDIEITEGMAKEAGFRFTPNLVPYQSEFIPRYRDVNGDFEGIAYKPLTPANPGDPLEGLINVLAKRAGASFAGFDSAGKGDFSGDPFIEDQVSKARSEVDAEKRRVVVQDIQRYAAGKMYFVRALGGATGLSLWWPAVRNATTYQGSLLFNFYEWIDDSQPPLKK